uniref:hypothetical protein n=1 Tax=Acinetobacter pittii TaxID=48296 RepID=UPI001D18F034|nr:hypothetical protein [Acinetobacter pittii]
MIELAKQRAVLMAEVKKFKKDCMELWFVPDLADSYKNSSLFEYLIDDEEVIFMKEQARQLWTFWNKAKAQAVPDGYVLMPKVPTEKMENAFGIGMLESKHFFGGFEAFNDAYSAMVKASESGAANE